MTLERQYAKVRATHRAPCPVPFDVYLLALVVLARVAAVRQ